MPAITLLFGLLFIALGAAFYGVGYANATPEDPVHWTAAIPAIPGVLLVLLGLVGYVASLRPHAMHAAALIGLLAFLAGAGKAVGDLSKAGFDIAALGNTKATLSSGLMGALGLAFVALCVASFLAARKKRKALAASAAAPITQ
ncbi:MAG: hypothetical protein AAF823_14740 [Planctomycetota bacterium]